MPADHVTANLPAFHAAVQTAQHAAGAGGLVTFGIVRDQPETGYGYIRHATPRRNTKTCTPWKVLLKNPALTALCNT